MSGKTAWEKYKEKNGSTPLDMLNPNTKRISDEAALERFNICKSCPELIKVTSQCKKCGCFMKAKVTIEISKCPISKW
jgi:hypothetical protein